MRETAESKNWLVEDLLGRAEEELARDEAAENQRNEKEKQRYAQAELLRE